MTEKLDYKEEDIDKKECRFAVHVKEREGINPDIHYVKEVLTLKDGTRRDRVNLVENYQRPIWITKPAFRNHKEKKEFEDVDKLDMFKTTDSSLLKDIALRLKVPYLQKRRKELMSIPYIYGGDITGSSLIKLSYMNKNNFIQSPYTTCVLDIETGVTESNQDKILMVTLAMKGKVYTGCLKSFIEKTGDTQSRVKKAMETYLPDYSDIQETLEIFDDELEMIKKVFILANEWSPDFLVFWNINFDIPKIMNYLSSKGIDPIDVMADTSIPRTARMCYYKEGLTKKVTASGKVKPVNPSMLWNTLFLTAKFYAIDAMCVYKQKRLAKQEESSYALDHILGVELKKSKLKFKEADAFKKLKWHQFMQENYPIQYIVYNRYDCLSVLELDDKTKDLKIDLPSSAGITDFDRWTSNPKKIADALFIFAGKQKRIIGTVGKRTEQVAVIAKEEVEEDDEDDEGENVKDFKVLSLKDWIITLQSHLLLHEGLKIFSDFPSLVSNIRGMVMDVDVTSSYPSCTTVGNVSKETTLCEVISIDGIPEELFREQNLAILCGSVNAIEYGTKMFSLPNALEMLGLIKDSKKNNEDELG